MDDLKLYAKNEKELDTLVQTVRIFSEDIGMEFGIQKCAMVKLIRGQIVESSGIALPNGAEIRSLEQSEEYKYLGILQSDDTKNKEMKQTTKKECFRRVRKVLKASLNGKNTIESINSWAVATVRYSAGIVSWTKEDLREMDRKTRKLLTVYRCMHPQADVDRLYWKRKEGGGGLISIEDCITIEENSLGYYINTKQDQLLKEVCKKNIIKERQSPKEKKRMIIENRKERFREKPLHSAYFKETKDVKDEKESWEWLTNGYLKKETEGMLMAAQDQALRTNWVSVMIDKRQGSAMCRLCGERDETISHILSECKKLAQNEYKKWRHDKVAAVIHWHLCHKFGFSCGSKNYEHFVDNTIAVLENEAVKLLWDFSMQTESKIEHNRPDIVVIEKKSKTCYIIDVACPFDTRIEKKEMEKKDAYGDLKYEIFKVYKGEVNKVFIIPIIIGALGSVTKRFKSYLEQLKCDVHLEVVQRTCLLGSARILRKVLDTK